MQGVGSSGSGVETLGDSSADGDLASGAGGKLRRPSLGHHCRDKQSIQCSHVRSHARLTFLNLGDSYPHHLWVHHDCFTVPLRGQGRKKRREPRRDPQPALSSSGQKIIRGCSCLALPKIQFGPKGHSSSPVVDLGFPPVAHLLPRLLLWCRASRFADLVRLPM